MYLVYKNANDIWRIIMIEVNLLDPYIKRKGVM